MIRFGLYLGVVALTSACFSDPELPTCIDFDFTAEDFPTEGCGEPCTMYCDAMLELCPETYASSADCIRECGSEPLPIPVPGTFEATQGNSLSCRLSYLRAGDCRNASITGTEACIGVDCSDYCDLMFEHCEAAFPSRENCILSCEEVPSVSTPAMGTDPASNDDSDQNSIECRFKYAKRASELDDVEDKRPLCSRASFASTNLQQRPDDDNEPAGGSCGDPCELYCDQMSKNCTGTNERFPDGNCAEVCALMMGGGDHTDFDRNLDSIQCRAWHGGPTAAASDPVTHCPHSGVYDAVCGEPINPDLQNIGYPCYTYCDIVFRNCPDAYDDAAACEADCQSFPEVSGGSFDPFSIYPMSTTTCPTP